MCGTRRVAALLVAVCALLAVASPAGALDATPPCRINRSPEKRPMNAQANATVPTKGVDHTPATPWPTWAFDDSGNRRRVDGGRRGSTDELLQGAACKWQLPVDTLRAVAAQESWWDATTSATAARRGPGADQGRRSDQRRRHRSCCARQRVEPRLLRGHAARLPRRHFVLWRNQRAATTRAYTKGDLRGCVEAWYSGVGPTTWSAWYPTRIQQYFTQKRWTSPDFLVWTGWADWCRKAIPAAAAGYWNRRTG